MRDKNGHGSCIASVPVLIQRFIRRLASAAASAVVATAATVTAAAEQNHQQNDNPAASTIILETHNLQSPLCQIFLKQTVFCLFHSTLYATNEIV